MGERGIGGSKCGSTGVVAVAFPDNGKTKLLAANVGDARAVLSRKAKAMQLTVDHVPDRSAAVHDALHSLLWTMSPTGQRPCKPRGSLWIMSRIGQWPPGTRCIADTSVAPDRGILPSAPRFA